MTASDIQALLAHCARRLKRLVEKHKSGKALSEDDLLFLESSQQQTFDSLKSAAATLGIKATDLRALKDAGCPGFRGSRLCIAQARPWIKARESLAREGKLPDDKFTILERRLTIREQREKFEFDEMKGRYILKTDVAKLLTETAAKQQAILRQVLENEQPSFVAGLAPDQIRIANKNTVDRVHNIMCEIAEKWKV